jgi:hypothetical protein
MNENVLDISKPPIVTKDCLQQICAGDEIKNNHLLPLWRDLYKKTYVKYNLWDEKSGGVIYKGNWSPINQANTNYTIQTKIANKLNEFIYEDFIKNNIHYIQSTEVNYIEFDKSRIYDHSYLLTELNNYFFWLNYYSDSILVDLNALKKSDFLYELIEDAINLMGFGNYCEMCFEYYLKNNRKDLTNIERSGKRGSSIDFKGIDISAKESSYPFKKLFYQCKHIKIYNGYTIYDKLNIQYYKRKGINYIVLINFQDRDITKKGKLYVVHIEDFHNSTHKNKQILKFNPSESMEISAIFNSKLLYDFFIYSSRFNIEFKMEVVQNDYKCIFNKENKNVELYLPSNENDFDPLKIKNAWIDVINYFETEENKENELISLENRFH